MTYDVIIRDGLWFDGRAARRRPARWASATASSPRSPPARWTRPAAPKSSTRRASGSSPASSTCTPTTTPRCCWIPDCASRCATVSRPCCWACARCRRSTPTPTTPPTFSAGSRRCRASSSSVHWKTTRPGRHPRNTSRRSTACRLGPNVSSLLGHSDLRTAVLGLDRATDHDGGAHRRRTRHDGGDAR